MKIIVAGGTGFLGRPLVESLAADGHDVVVLTRSAGPGRFANPRVATSQWTPDGTAGQLAPTLSGAGAVINLAGESIAEGRWTEARKQQLIESRLLSTRTLVKAIDSMSAMTAPPEVFVSASAVGYYGPRGDEIVTEESAPGSDFLARLCVDWEAEAKKAEGRTRVVLVRTGLVLASPGGALGKLLPPFKMFVGGPMGSGRQYWPWIHRDDWVGMVKWLATNPATRGPFNATGPNPVTNAELSRALGRALHRPSLLPAPPFALRLALGEMADALLLTGQRAIPKRASAEGFAFRYPTVDAAMRAAVGGD